MNIMESVDKVEREDKNEENMPSTNTNDNKKEVYDKGHHAFTWS